MPSIATRQELIEYFVEKRDRGHEEGDVYKAALIEIIELLERTDDIAQIKSTIRKLHREKLAEIQATPGVEERIELRKQLSAYDDCLTQLRNIPIS